MRRRAADFHVRAIGFEAARKRIVVVPPPLRLLLLFRPRPRRFCCPCLTALTAPVLPEPSHHPSARARAWLLLDARARPRPSDPVNSSFTARALQPQSKAMALTILRHRTRVRGHGAQLGRSRHQCFSWAVSGADDTSPCCEQFNLLRIAPSTQPSLARNSTAGRMDDSTGPQTIAARGRIQGLSGHMLQPRVLAATQRRFPATSRCNADFARQFPRLPTASSAATASAWSCPTSSTTQPSATTRRLSSLPGGGTSQARPRRRPALDRIEIAHLRLEPGDIRRAHVGRIGNQHIEGPARCLQGRRHAAMRTRASTPSRRHCARATSRAAALMSVPSPWPAGSSHSRVSSRQPDAGADIQDAQGLRQPALLARDFERGRDRASRCRGADRGSRARWQRCGHRSRARPRMRDTGSRCRRRSTIAAAERCSSAAVSSRSGAAQDVAHPKCPEHRRNEPARHRRRPPRCRRAQAAPSAPAAPLPTVESGRPGWRSGPGIFVHRRQLARPGRRRPAHRPARRARCPRSTSSSLCRVRPMRWSVTRPCGKL